MILGMSSPRELSLRRCQAQSDFLSNSGQSALRHRSEAPQNLCVETLELLSSP